MLAPTSSPNAGSRLRAEREALRLSSRDVERLSYEIAVARRDMRYYLSHSWVTDIENGKYKPSVLKLRSLSLIYRCDYDEFLVLVRHSHWRSRAQGITRNYCSHALISWIQKNPAKGPSSPRPNCVLT